MSSVVPATPRSPRRALARGALGLLIIGLSLGAWAAAAGAHGSVPSVARGASAADTAAAAQDELGPGRAVVLGLVEGVTEFLPISSTGHLTVVERLLGMTSDDTKDARDAYAIVIQAGAILAVVVLYRQRLVSVANGAIGRDA